MLATFVLRRLVLGLLTVFVIVSASFFFLRALPGDPAEIWLGDYATDALCQKITEHWGLDRPIYEQYVVFLWNILHGDLGTSLRSAAPVSKLIWAAYPYTFRLMIGSVVIGLVLGSLAGVFAATRRNTIHDAITMVVSFIFISIPGFVTAYLLLYIFSIKARLFPVIGGETPGNYGTYFKYLFLPCLAWGFRTTGIVSRMVRSSMIDVLNEDYVRTARSKGLSEKVVLYKHGMKNALTSVVGLMGVEIIILLGGVVIPEMVFSRPGLGRLYFMGISARDYPLIQGCVLVIATSVVLVNSIVDILYGVVDPRVRYA